MRKLLLLLLTAVMGLGCARLEIDRIAKGTANLDLRGYSDLVIVTRDAGITGAQAAFTRRAVDEAGFFTVSTEARYRDSPDKTPLALVIETGRISSRNAPEGPGLRSVGEYDRGGSRAAALIFALKDYRAYKRDPAAPSLYERSYPLGPGGASARWASARYEGGAPAAGGGEASVFETAFRDFNAAAFPHYNRFVYPDYGMQKPLGVRGGLRAFEAKDYKTAAEVFERVIDWADRQGGVTSEDLAKVHFYLGLTLEKQGDFKRAVAEYNKALALDPGFTDCVEARSSAEQCGRDLDWLSGKTP